MFDAAKERACGAREDWPHGKREMNVVTAFLTVVLLSASPQAAAKKPLYRWLINGELEALLRGTRIMEADDRSSYMRTPEEFHKDGSYVRHADNYEAHGKYTFRNGAVCDYAYGEREVCRRILIDKEGRYWIIGRYNSQIMVRVSIQPLR